MIEFEPVEGVSLVWGESLRYDDRRDRVYFVDCATNTLHWLDAGTIDSFALPSLPTGVALTEDGRLVICLGDGLHVVDADARITEFLAPYPDGLGARANDATADLHGNLVTGTLNLGEGDGSYWWYSVDAGWRRLAGGISNANGPVVLDSTLVFADTAAGLYAYADYDGLAGTVGARRLLGPLDVLGGHPDGGTGDAAGGAWSCVLGAGRLARFTVDGFDQAIAAPFEQPSDVCFGGPDLTTMYVVDIAIDLGRGGGPPASPLAGRLVAVHGTGFAGRPEPRMRL